MLVIMPLGGRGQRFIEAGYKVPKPMLDLQGEPLFRWALKALDNLQSVEVYLGVHPGLWAHYIVNWTPKDVTLCTLLRETRGPLETVMDVLARLSTSLKSRDPELLVLDGDSLVGAQELAEAIGHFRESDADGGALVQVSDSPEVSYGIVKEGGWITETAERQRISFWSTTGPYWWRSTWAFRRQAEQALRGGHVSCSPVYNYTAKDGGRVKAFTTKTFVHLGTPAAFEAYKQAHQHAEPPSS